MYIYIYIHVNMHTQKIYMHTYHKLLRNVRQIVHVYVLNSNQNFPSKTTQPHNDYVYSFVNIYLHIRKHTFTKNIHEYIP
jgi:hypothetical protein